MKTLPRQRSTRVGAGRLAPAAPLRRALVEHLERRQLLASASLSAGILTVNGDAGVRNSLAVELNSTGNILAKYNGATKTFTRSAVQKIVVRGGGANDYLAVTAQLTIPATFFCGDGNDTVWAGSGNDTIWGGAGHDSLNGRNGDDVFYGEDGNDTINGGAGNDKANGGAGGNVLSSTEGTASVPGTGSTGSTGSGTGAPTTPTGQLPETGTPQAVITALNSTITAGQAIHVHALNSVLNGGAPITARYEWNFGDPNGEYNTLVGWNAAHIYNNPGTYTITLRLTNEGGKTDIATRQISVLADNRRTIYVSADGNDANGGGAGSPVRSLARAKALVGGSSDVQVLLRRGDRFTTGSSWAITGDNVTIGAYGSGPMPELYYNGPRIWTAMFLAMGNNITFENLTFNSHFYDLGKDKMPDGVGVSGDNVTVVGSQFLNVGNAVSTLPSSNGLLVQDSTAPSDIGLRSYFVWMEGTDKVLLGNRVVNSTREAIFRVGNNGSRLLMHGNDFTNRSRVSAGDWLDTAKNTITIQWGSYAYITGNRFSRGPVRVGPLGEADGFSVYNSRFNHAVLEGNRFDTPVFALHGLSHAVFRNNVSMAHGYTAYTIEGYSNEYNRQVTNVSLLNNTVINAATSGQFVRLEGRANGISLVNNLYSAPNLRPGNSTTAPVYVQEKSLSSFTIITNNVWSMGRPENWVNGGVNYIDTAVFNQSSFLTPAEWNALPQVGTDVFSDVTVNGCDAPPADSVAASAARVFAGVFVDFYGKPRTGGSWSAGAVEV